jgi:hypothetical protein
MTPPADPRPALRREIVKVSRRLAVLNRVYGHALDNAWVFGMIRAAEDRLFTLRHELAAANRFRRP